MIADSQTLSREALCAAARRHDGLAVTEEVSTADGLAAALRAPLDVALASEDLVAGAGIPSGEDGPAVVVLGEEPTPERIAAAFASGASGYVVRRMSSEAICTALVAVGRGETVLPRELQQQLCAAMRCPRPAALPLSERELAVLELTADGFDRAEIARRLFLSPSTIKTHLASVYTKLGVADRAAAVAAGFRTGLLT